MKAFKVRSIDLNDYLIDLRGIYFISHGKGGAQFYYATRVFTDLSTSFTMLYNNTKLTEKKKGKRKTMATTMKVSLFMDVVE